MIFNSAGRRPVVIGKPSPLKPHLAMERNGYTREETAVVGDRIYTDVKSGLDASITGILVMSGETTEQIPAESIHKPHLARKHARDACRPETKEKPRLNAWYC